MSVGPHGAAFVSSQPGTPRWTTISFALAAGATVDLPGPAVGFVRLYDYTIILPNAVAAPLVGVTLNLISGVAFLCQTATGTNSAIQLVTIAPLGNGELYRVFNGGATAGRVTATYRDIPASRLSLVRLTVTAALQTAIPTPPVGFVRRWFNDQNGNVQSIIGTSRVNWCNPDTVGHTLQQSFNGTLVMRSNNNVALNNVNPNNQPRMVVSAATGPLQVNTSIAIVTTPTVLVGAYETLSA